MLFCFFIRNPPGYNFKKKKYTYTYKMMSYLLYDLLVLLLVYITEIRPITELT